MKSTLLCIAVTVGLLSTGCSSNLVHDGPVSVSVANWHNANDAFGGLKKVTFSDDLYLAVSKSGIYDKDISYEVLPGYHWATFAELEQRLNKWKTKNGSRDLRNYHYHSLGGWEKYEFGNVQRRDFIFADTATNGRVVYAGIPESKTIEHKSSWDKNYTDTQKLTVKNWAGFVLIKDKKKSKN